MFRFSLSLFAAVSLLAQDTMHDAPAALENGSVKAALRSDTIVDRNIFSMPPHVLMAHTHQFNHVLRVNNPGRPVSQILLGPADEIRVRLSSGQPLVVTQQNVPGAGGAVQGHAAIAGTRLTRDPRSHRDVDTKLAAKGHNETPNWMWVFTAPSGTLWRPVGPDTDASISTKVLNTGTPTNHSANAQTVRYQLFNGADGNITMQRLEVWSQGQKKQGTPTVELGPNASVYLCENRRIAGRVMSACMTVLPNQQSGTNNPLPN